MNMVSKLKIGLPVLAVSMLALGVGQANATATGFANLSTSNVEFSSGGSKIDFSDFTALSGQVTSQSQAGITSGSPIGSATNTASQSISTSGLNGNPDVLQSIVQGSGTPIAEDTFGVMHLGDQVSRSDSNATGSSIGAGFANGAAQTEAETNFVNSGHNVGASQTYVKNASQFTFALAGTGARTVDFTFSAAVQLYSSLGQYDSGNASATTSFSFELQDATGKELLLWNPDGTTTLAKTDPSLNASVTADTASLNNTVQVFGPGSQGSLAPTSGSYGLELTLADNTSYTLTILQEAQTNVDATVPAPATLALLGFGMMVAGFVWRRRQTGGGHPPMTMA